MTWNFPINLHRQSPVDFQTGHVQVARLGPYLAGRQGQWEHFFVFRQHLHQRRARLKLLQWVVVLLRRQDRHLFRGLYVAEGKLHAKPVHLGLGYFRGFRTRYAADFKSCGDIPQNGRVKQERLLENHGESTSIFEGALSGADPTATEGDWSCVDLLPVEALQQFAGRELLFEPGTKYRHSTYGWILVSAAVEAAANQPFLSFMRRQIFKPLGMDQTVADSATEPIRDRATFYFPRFAADPRYGPDMMRPIDISCYAGSGTFLSTPSDLVHFGMAINSGKLLQPATVQLLQTSQRLPSGQETGYGLGWDLETVTLAGHQTQVVGHDGESLGGMVASLMTFREQGIVVAVTSNISYADTSGLAAKIAQPFAEQRSTPARQ